MSDETPVEVTHAELAPVPAVPVVTEDPLKELKEFLASDEWAHVKDALNTFNNDLTNHFGPHFQIKALCEIMSRLETSVNL